MAQAPCIRSPASCSGVVTSVQSWELRALSGPYCCSYSEVDTTLCVDTLSTRTESLNV